MRPTITAFAPRVTLGLGVVLIGALLVLEMSGSAARTAGSNHVSPLAFSVTVPGGGGVCQSIGSLPGDAAAARVVVGTYGHSVPALDVVFADRRGRTVFSGDSPARAMQGPVDVPLARRSPAAATQMCVHVSGPSKVSFVGESGPAVAVPAVVNGRVQGGAITVLYMRRGSESWWHLLPTLARRFGLGKASFFGTWTFPVVVLVLLLTCGATIRLLYREVG